MFLSTILLLYVCGQYNMPKERIEPTLSELIAMNYAISGQESSYGKNVKHKPITSGPNAGLTAEGRYAHLPTTTEQMKRNYPEIGDNPTDEDVQDALLKHLWNKHAGDPQAVLAAHRHGTTDSTDELKEKGHYVSKYVQAALPDYRKELARQEQFERDNPDFEKEVYQDLGMEQEVKPNRFALLDKTMNRGR
jgi:hypothetical protein